MRQEPTNERRTTVDDHVHEVPHDARRLVDWLRDDLGSRSVKEGCGAGHCGACTVLLDEAPVLSCCQLAAITAGKSVRTAEWISRQPVGAVLAEELVRHGGLQCGFCTPGMITIAYALLSGGGRMPSFADIREYLAGNVCRCTGYAQIVEAVQSAAKILERKVTENMTEQKTGAEPVPRTPAPTVDEAFVHACAQGWLDVARWFLERGVDPNAAWHDGMTGLHRAIEHSNADIVSLVLEHGADRALRDKNVQRDGDDWAHHVLGERPDDLVAQRVHNMMH